MQRRHALKNMALAMGGLVALPAWAEAWTPATVPTGLGFLTGPQEQLLEHLVDTIIPATDTPGAQELKVPLFVQTMLADCYEPQTQADFAQGLNTTDDLARQTYQQAFAACDTAQRLALLGSLEISTDPKQKTFFKLLKDLTIQGYLTSEYVLVNHLNYQMVPGHFYGCVPVPTPTK